VLAKIVKGWSAEYKYAEEHYDSGRIKRRGVQVNAKEVVKTK
jgi:hypothetical protein